MALEQLSAIVTDSLKSDQVRNAIFSQFGNQDRTLSRASNGLYQIAGSVVQAAWGLIGQIFGWAQWGYSTLISWIQQGKNYIWNFNWNSSDADLQAQIKSAETALAAINGGAFGNLLGYTTCGIVPGAGIFVFNQPLGLYLLREVGEEMFQEAMGHAAAIINASLSLTAQTLFVNSYTSNRAFYNLIVNWAGRAIDAIVPGNLSWDNYRKQRANKGLVSFADFVEESLETLPAPQQAFWEQFFEEAEDACWESLYVIAGSLDNWVAQQKLAKDVLLGPERRVEITPNREQQNERIILVGPENLIKPQIVQTLATHQQFDNREVGTVIAAPPEEIIRRRPNARLITITMRSTPRPPWKAGVGDGEYKDTSIEIPDARRSITWEQVKLACGGANGYNYGRYKAIATLSNYRTMSCYASTEDEAKDRLKAYASLSEANILFMDVNEEVKEGIRLTNPNLYKDPIRVYPAHFAILAHEKILGGETGYNTTAGKLRRQRYVIDLWPDEEPDDASAMIADLFSNQDLTP